MIENFYYWGPLLTFSTIPHNCLTTINTVCNQSKILNVPHEHFLPLKFKKEISISGENKEKVINLINPYFEEYLNFYNLKFSSASSNSLYKINHTKMWVNFQQKGEFRPPHFHTGDLSYILYVDIPQKLIEEHEQHKHFGEERGSINFSWAHDANSGSSNPIKPNVGYHFFPKNGDFFIFPSYLNHFSMNFFSNCVRTSISGNIELIK